MSTLYWLGTATAVQQVTTVQITGYDVATSYKVTVGGQVISVVGQGGTAATTAAALAAAWNASTHPYATAVTAAAVATDTITFTADTAGVPFVITSSVTGGAGTIGAATAVTVNAGPNVWSTAANWSTGAVPVNSDTVYIRNSSVSILWGLAQSGVTPTLLVIEQSFTGTIGLPYNKLTTGSGSYNTTVPEYRDQFLAIGAAAVRIGENYASGNVAANGSALIKLDLGTTNAAVLIFNSGNSTDGLPPIRLKNTHASSTAKIYGASKVGVCWEDPGSTGQLSEIDTYAGAGGSPSLFVGPGVTLATLIAGAGDCTLKNAPTAAKVESGAKLTLAGSGTITTLEKRGDLVMAGTYSVTNLKG
jgi:hypothetical protein